MFSFFASEKKTTGAEEWSWMWGDHATGAVAVANPLRWSAACDPECLIRSLELVNQARPVNIWRSGQGPGYDELHPFPSSRAAIDYVKEQIGGHIQPKSTSENEASTEASSQEPFVIPPDTPSFEPQSFFFHEDKPTVQSQAPSPEASPALGRAPSAVASQPLGRVSSGVDDNKMAEFAKNAALDEHTFKELTEFPSSHAMKTFVLRIIEENRGQVNSNTTLRGVASKYSGIRKNASVSFKHLVDELMKEGCIPKDASIAEVPTAEAPISQSPGADGPPNDALIAEAPAAEVPILQSSRAVQPRCFIARDVLYGADGPSNDALIAEAPTAKTPISQPSGADGPQNDAPIAEAPAAEVPISQPSGAEGPMKDQAAKGKGGKKGGPPPAPTPNKGKGKGKIAVAEPEREEHADWEGKCNPLRWKRVLRADDVFVKSWFKVEGDVASTIDEEKLRNIYAKDAPRHSITMKGSISGKKAPKKSVWEDPGSRMKKEIQMKQWNDAAKFLELLDHLEILTIKDNKEMMLWLPQCIEMVGTISAIEWERLQMDAGQIEEYEWKDDVEGFFRKLGAIKAYEKRLAGLKTIAETEEQLQGLQTKTEKLFKGLEAIHESKAVLQPLLVCILEAGNRFNAGQPKLCRADGFDVVDLLEQNHLSKFKPQGGGQSLLDYLKENHLTDESCKMFKGLGMELAEFASEAKKDHDNASPQESSVQANGTMADLRQDNGELERKLGLLKDAMEAADERRKKEAANAPDSSTSEQLLAESKLIAQFHPPFQALSCEVGEAGGELDKLEEKLIMFGECLAHKPLVSEPAKADVNKIFGMLGCFAQELGSYQQKGVKSKRKYSLDNKK